ncbi:hypothetical protein ACSFA0_22805 [Variovorax sp. LT1P1]|uniref:hypothetical protein n=1 Tax=Variovorax sp. LT1P1 TaxID=3443730 RepID=UPI003F465C23
MPIDAIPAPADKPVFYSKLAIAIASAPERLAIMPAGQWAAWLGSNAARLGVKRDEIESCGLEQYLEAAGTARLHKSELCSHVARHGVRLGEQISVGTTEREYDAAARAVNAALRERLDESVIDKLRDVRDDLRARLDDEGETRFAEFNVPGGTNYREILITHQLPASTTDVASARRHLVLLGSKDQAALSDEDAVARAIENDWCPAGGHRNGHWQRADVLVHVRVDDRVDPEGRRVLFVQEVQSDPGQAGRRLGFQGDGPVMTDSEEGALRHHYSELIANHALFRDAQRSTTGGVPRADVSEPSLTAMLAVMGVVHMRDALRAAGLDAARAELLHPGRFTVAKAPFITDTKSWVALALKRVMVLAAREGYDRVAVITGQQASDVYDLGKAADRVVLEVGPGQNSFVLTTHRGEEEVHRRTVKDETDAACVIGAAAAAQLFESVSKPRSRGRAELRGVSLSVADHGLVSFYDEIVPQVLRDLLKKLDGEITQVPINGMGLEVIDAGGYFYVRNQARERVGLNLKTFAAAEASRRAIEMQVDAQPGFDITGSMRARLSQGVPLFGLEVAPTVRHIDQDRAERAIAVVNRLSAHATHKTGLGLTP